MRMLDLAERYRRDRERVLDVAYLAFSPSPAVLATVARQKIFYTPAEVTGKILSYKVKIAGVSKAWGGEALVGQEFEVTVTAQYSAADAKHTRMDLTVWKPSGASFKANDDDLWPYASPGETISFLIRGVAGEAFDINEAGIWEAKLEYVWVE